MAVDVPALPDSGLFDAGNDIIIDGTFSTPDKANGMSNNVNIVSVSDGAGNVIIMEPYCVDEEAYKSFFSNDLQIAKNLRQSILNDNVLNVRKNKFLKIDLKPCNSVTIDKLR